MDAKTPELLLKLRKSATASFGLKEWTTVLSEVGFKVEVTRKEGRSVTQVTVWSPLLQTLVINKEANYKAIHFYALPRWLKNEAGVDTVEVASIRLGMETPEKEAQLRDLYVRDLTDTGTCPVCGGNFKRNTDGSLVHHGFTRPGDGEIHGDCFGVAYQPWELDPVGAVDFLAQVLVPNLELVTDYLERLKNGSITQFTRTDRYSTGNKTVTVSKGVDSYEFECLLDREIAVTVRRAADSRKAVKRFEDAIYAWKLDILPEFKHAGKFRGA